MPRGGQVVEARVGDEEGGLQRRSSGDELLTPRDQHRTAQEVGDDAPVGPAPGAAPDQEGAA